MSRSFPKKYSNGQQVREKAHNNAVHYGTSSQN